jgi:hypothetical protein
MSQAAVFSVCQIPERSGLPSAVFGIAVPCPRTTTDADTTTSSTIPTPAFIRKAVLKAAHDITLTGAISVWFPTVVSIYRKPGTFMSTQEVDVYAEDCG